MISVIQGDVIEILKDYPDESFTATLCDPPYGLKFMDKKWDHGVPATPYWAEILRVLKPGAILMAFSGTRTWHRLGVAIEDAGFELFDTMMWLHAQGFPKSRAIGKAIDKEAGVKREIVGQKIRGDVEQAKKSGVTMAAAYANRNNKAIFGYGIESITIPATDAAKIWEGYGTSLKPAFEPILLARKPRQATYAQTAMEHHTAALNIDGCRIASAKPYTINTWNDGAKPFGDGAGHPFTGRQQSGRWPANLILDEIAAKILDEQVGERKSGYMKPGQRRKSSRGLGGYHNNFPDEVTTKGTYGDSGGPSRFFYCSKANKRERNMGLPEGERNLHTTVKPLTLCEYLARLIIPPKEYRDEAQLLVPFAGVMSEVIGALLAGWKNITAIDIEKEYCEIGQKRIDWWIAKIEETGLTDPKAILKRYKNANPSN